MALGRDVGQGEQPQHVGLGGLARKLQEQKRDRARLQELSARMGEINLRLDQLITELTADKPQNLLDEQAKLLKEKEEKGQEIQQIIARLPSSSSAPFRDSQVFFGYLFPSLIHRQQCYVVFSCKHKIRRIIYTKVMFKGDFKCVKKLNRVFFDT